MGVAFAIGRSVVESLFVIILFFAAGSAVFGSSIGGPIAIFPTLALWIVLSLLIYGVIHR